eukprot:gene5124-10247_t
MKRTLEEAINIAKLDSDDKENMIVIDRTKYLSRKGGRCCSVTRGDQEIKNNFTCEKRYSNVGEDDDLTWKSRFMQMKQLHFESEKDLENTLILNAERESEFRKYMNVLEEKNEYLESLVKIKELDSNPSVENEVLKMKRALKFYEVLTSVSLKADEDQNMVCTMKNKINKRVTRFVITNPDDNIDSMELDYRPIANVELFPEYLHNHITFNPNMAPILLGDILQAVYAENDNGE